jgi:ureidoacrylate peracid hydrolase
MFSASNGLLIGSWDADVFDGLGRDPADHVIDKTRYDAFLNTALEQILRGIGVQRVVIAGIITNACVETTARGALMRDFDVTVLRDCCAGRWRKHHDAALDALSAYGLAQVTEVADAFRLPAQPVRVGP